MNQTERSNPGSPEALAQGCRCPVIDNGYGRGVDIGIGERVWWMSEDCPLHGAKTMTGGHAEEAERLAGRQP